MKVLTSVGIDKKDMVKASNAVTGFQDVVGVQIVMIGAIIYEKQEENEKGEMETKTVSCLKQKDGEFITSISPTVQNSLETICTAYEEKEITAGLPVVVKSKKTKAGRDFLYLDLV